MKNLDTLNGLVHDLNVLRSYKDIFKKATSDSSCDKKGMGFNLDDRFAAFSCKISFDSWRGYFGNSGCSNVISFQESKEVSKSFVRYLKAHEQEIMHWMADDILRTADEIKKEALKEIESANEFINSIEFPKEAPQ